MMARILELETTNKDLEQEIRQLKENCTCPKDTAGDFRIVPLLAMRKIFEFLSFDDLKELRCVSSWFFTTVLDEFKSGIMLLIGLADTTCNLNLTKQYRFYIF